VQKIALTDAPTQIAQAIAKAQAASRIE